MSDYLFELAIIPVALLLIYIYCKDSIKKEPIGLLIKALFGGILSAVATITLFLFIDPDAASWEPALLSAFGQAFVEASIPEEFFKFFFLWIIIWSNRHFDEHFDGIVYAVFVSMGFAGFENIFYVISGGASVGIMRALTAVPAHFLFGVIMGYYFALAKFGPRGKRSGYIGKALLMPMIAHGIYDMTLMFGSDLGEEFVWLSVILMIFFFYFNIKLWKHCLKRMNQLAEKDEEKFGTAEED